MWDEVLSATHGVFFTTKGQTQAWEGIFREEIKDLRKGEVEKALKEAAQRNEPTKNYRMTAYDIVGWVTKSRRGWAERSEIKDGWEYFPDRDRICGQIQRKKIINVTHERRCAQT